MTAGPSASVAFGFRVDGIGSPALTQARHPCWPELHIRHRIEWRRGGPSHLDEASARLPLGGGDWLQLARDEQTAIYLTQKEMDADRLIHPWLAPAAGFMARWLGREAFHAGAFLAGGGGLGAELDEQPFFKSNVAVAGGLAVLLAAALDVIILTFQRLVTPWQRAAA